MRFKCVILLDLAKRLPWIVYNLYILIYEILLMDTSIRSWNKEEGNYLKVYSPSFYGPSIVILQSLKKLFLLEN